MANLDFRSERFELFMIYKYTRYLLSILKLIGLSVQAEKFKIYFQDCGHAGIRISSILAIFDPQIALFIPTKICQLGFSLRRRF